MGVDVITPRPRQGPQPPPPRLPKEEEKVFDAGRLGIDPPFSLGHQLKPGIIVLCENQDHGDFGLSNQVINISSLRESQFITFSMGFLTGMEDI